MNAQAECDWATVTDSGSPDKNSRPPRRPRCVRGRCSFSRMDAGPWHTPGRAFSDLGQAGAVRALVGGLALPEDPFRLFIGGGAMLQ